MDGVDIKACEFALSKIDDGFVFEKFAQRFLSNVLGYEFVPVGGLKDRGIDGLEHLFHRDSYERNIYQISIDKNCTGKLETTLAKLKKNKITFGKLHFVTNQLFPKKDKTIDDLYDKYKKGVHIFDLHWFSTNVNRSPETINTYITFISSYFHEFSLPGKSYEVSDLVDDPRLFVFLRQQWESNRNHLELDEVLADTLILYCLEGTEPDKHIFKTREKIKEDIANHIKYDPQLLYATIDKRLDILSSKPRRIMYHTTAKAYCLPYATRLEIQERNFKDMALYETFKAESEEKLKIFLQNVEVKVKDCVLLIETTINRLFYQQGLEFADFVLHGENKQAFEKDLPEIINSVVDESHVAHKNKEEVKASLLTTIRDIVYNGTQEQKMFLERLSNTYMMLFLLQCDPKLAIYFGTMAAKLNIYVCTSILIPALSEYYLEPIHKRHWNLLKGAHNAGVTLIVNEIIISELVAHFRMIKSKYESDYKDDEDLYLSNEMHTLYIDHIMVRAYFYAKTKHKVDNFYNFLENFVDADLSNAEEDIIEWLKEEFGIQYQSQKSLGIEINTTEEKALFEELEAKKSHPAKAQSDTRLILTIYAIRDKNNETDSSGIFGFKTWWLSTDTTTQKAVNSTFGNKYKVSCYIRPDFLYNYISLAPTRAQVTAAYDKLFPSLLGVNISSHLPKEVTDYIHKVITEHKTKNTTRLKATLRTLADQLKSNRSYGTRKHVEHYLDEKLKDSIPSS